MSYGKHKVEHILQKAPSLSTDANNNTVLTAGDTTIRLTSGEIASAQGTAFSVPNGYTAGTAATPVALGTSVVDTSGILVDLAGDFINSPAGMTHVKVSANVLFASNATGSRYIAVEQYMTAMAMWVPVIGFYDERPALSGVATPLALNATIQAIVPAAFPKMRVSVGQSSGGALNCTPYGVTFEFFKFA